jgi:D-arabinose 1-dehydrogenase-like Zn-dependent alcohol dehydrogenase
MMSIEGSDVGTLQDLRELLQLAQAGKIAPIPIEARSAERATESLRDLRTGGKVRGRVVMTHQPGVQ